MFEGGGEGERLFRQPARLVLHLQGMDGKALDSVGGFFGRGASFFMNVRVSTPRC